MSILQEVRDSAAFVAQESTWVRIDFDRLMEYAASLAEKDLTQRGRAGPSHFIGSVQDTVAFILTSTSVNFGSGWHPVLQKLPGASGAITMRTHLVQRFLNRGPLTAIELSSLTRESCAELFGQDPLSPAGELMELFARSLSDLGRFLSENFNQSFVELVKSADHSADALAEHLIEMPLFDDAEQYRGRRVPLLKRAQIASSDLAHALGGESIGTFNDLDRLTIFSDNLVPHVLRIEGVLQFDSGLVERIEREELLQRGSEEEVEIRSVAIHAAECIIREMRKVGSTATAADLDAYLWAIGQDSRYKAYPRHRCRSPFY